MLGRRILFKLRYRFADQHLDEKKLQEISKKPFFKHYQNGISLSLQNHLEEANRQFQDSLKQIKNSQQDALEHYSLIAKRIIHNHRRLGQYKLAQQKIYELIKQKRSNPQTTRALIYDDYNMLFKHLITYDLQKAVKLCKALLSRQQEQMPIAFTKMFNMNLGIAYLLAGNYQDSKKRFSKCLDADPQGKVKTFALNNLGLACWWHKNPFEQLIDIEDIQQNNDKIVRDFSKSKQLFIRSLRQAEKIDRIQDQEHKFLLDQTLSLNSQKLQQKLIFLHQQSLLPLFNLAEFHLANDPIQKSSILYWYSRALSLSKRIKNDKIFDRIYIEYSFLNSQIQDLQKELPILIDKNRCTQQFAQETYYCKMLAKILHLKKKQQAQQYVKRAKIIDSVLPIWTPKLRYVAYEELNLLL